VLAGSGALRHPPQRPERGTRPFVVAAGEPTPAEL